MAIGEAADVVVPPSHARDRAITLLVLGDESVGKSSLISTFVSRYFSADGVPGLMTRVCLPPEPHLAQGTMIVDTQRGDAVLQRATVHKQHQQDNEDLVVSGEEEGTSSTAIALADCIILVLDASRPATLTRMGNHWLPLIEKAYRGKVPVIIAENKIDRLVTDSMITTTSANSSTMTGGPPSSVQQRTTTSPSKRDQIMALLHDFPFVRQYLKCSAKDFGGVDDVFRKAQQAVLYPLTPLLYNLSEGRLSMPLQRALTRIFRIYDTDRDGLLSDDELAQFQQDVVVALDWNVWKNVVVQHYAEHPTTGATTTATTASDTTTIVSTPVVLLNGMFTLTGFLTIFDVFMSQNRLDVVWQTLRHFQYNDELELPPLSAYSSSSWPLNTSERAFLVHLFHQFKSLDGEEELLTPQNLLDIFCVLPPPCLPPWHPQRSAILFANCRSQPKKAVTATEGDDSGDRDDDDDDNNNNQNMGLGNSEASHNPVSSSTITTQQPNLSNSGISILSFSDSLPTLESLPSVASAANKSMRSLSLTEWMGEWHSIAAISSIIARRELWLLGYVEDADDDAKPAGKSKRDLEMRRLSYASREMRVLVLGKDTSDRTNLVAALETKPATVSETGPSAVYPETTHSCCTVQKRRTQEDVTVHVILTDVPESYTEAFFVSSTPPTRRYKSHEIDADLILLLFDATNEGSLDYCRRVERQLLPRDMPRVYVATMAHNEQSVWLKAVQHCSRSSLALPLPVEEGSLSPSNNRFDREAFLKHLTAAVFNDVGTAVNARPLDRSRRRMVALYSFGTVAVVVGAAGTFFARNQNRLEWMKSWLFGWAMLRASGRSGSYSR